MKPTTNNLECEHEWKIISTWGAKTLFARRECQKCKRVEDAIISDCKWNEYAPITFSSTNNLEWEERFDKIKLVSAQDDSQEQEDLANKLNDVLIPYKNKVKQFISELRKKDMEELIKMMPEEIVVPKKLGRPRKTREGQLKISKVKLIEVGELKQLIKDYYNK
jgi:hypothetical protein